MPSEYFSMVSPTYIENWHPSLCQLSIAQIDIPLTREDARGIGQNMMELSEPFGEFRTDIDPLRQRVREAVARFPNGTFIRLGSRSPKDAWSWHRDPGPKITPEDADPLRFMLDCSERMADDLLLALKNDYEPHIFVRQWVDIPPWTEFRCFAKARRFVGACQGNYRLHSAEIDQHQSIIRWGIGCFYRQHFLAACHLDDVVFDVFVKLSGRDNDRAIEVKLLEINPFCEMTDPCLFTWQKGGDLDRTFRYVRADGGQVRFPLE